MSKAECMSWVMRSVWFYNPIFFLLIPKRIGSQMACEAVRNDLRENKYKNQIKKNIRIEKQFVFSFC